ncbi:MAG: hypothetical protein LUH22_03130 [Bacteroides sp.]|nr:hypothetical protein [Bacteroides sp.]
MKKLFLLSVFVLISIFSYSQEEKYIYCEIVGTSKLLSSKVTIEIDHGQATKFWSNDKRLLGEDGKPIKFNSMVDAMNFMGNDGWEFTQAYVVSVQNQNAYHWLLKKDVSKLTEEEKRELLETYRTKKSDS